MANWLPYDLKRRVMTRDRDVCQYCGDRADTIDHLIPLSRGGTDDISNLVACCQTCNVDKDDWLPLEYMFVRGNRQIEQKFLRCKWCRRTYMRMIGHGKEGRTKVWWSCPQCKTSDKPIGMRGKIAYYVVEGSIDYVKRYSSTEMYIKFASC